MPSQFYETLFDRIQDCVAVYRVLNGGEDFIFADFNPAAEKADQVQKKNLIGKKVTEVFPAIKAFGLFAVFQKVYRTGEATHFPLTFYSDKRITGWRDNYVYKIDDEYIVAVYQDLTRQKQDEAQLKLSARVFEFAKEGIIITDQESNILQVNEAYVRLSGYTREEMIGRKAKFMKSNLHTPDFYRNMWGDLHKTGHWEGEIWDRNKEGMFIALYLMISAMKNEEGETTNYIGIYLDMTEQKKAQEHINKLAYYDVLTNLGNRTLFLQELQTLIDQSQRLDHTLALLFLDLDNFKYINDTYGHNIGDLLLIEAAKRIKKLARKSDFIARLGGDEFTIIITNIDSPASAGQIASELTQSLSETYTIDNITIHTTATVGIAVFPADGNDPHTLLRNADTAMYNAKRKGKNRYTFFAQEMNEMVRRRIELDTDLREALDLNQLLLHYQPKICLNTGKMHGYEALIRWNHPDKGLVPPDVFIPVAEMSNLILDIGKWVFKEAIQFQKELAQNNHIAPISVNVSSKQLYDEKFCPDLLEILDRTNCDPQYLEIEITESILMRNIEKSIEQLLLLKKRGIRISIDDFGTGYSSMSYLTKLPIDAIKIDKSFVVELERKKDARGIIKAIVALSKSLSLETIAEGVETPRQVRFLRNIKCNLAQGYYFSRPLPAEELLSPQAV